MIIMFLIITLIIENDIYVIKSLSRTFYNVYRVKWK